jgi:hypothetical protein
MPEIAAAADQFIRPAKVSLTSPNRDVQIRYTLDGSEPSPSSPIYGSALRISRTTTIKAKAFKGGRPVSGTRIRTLEKASPMPALQVAHTEQGLIRTTYRGDWDQLPDFASMTPTATDTVKKIRIAKATDEHVGHRFTGYFRAPRDDVYLFKLASDDGSRLLIDGKTVIDLDGAHGTMDKTAPAPLAKGWHAITLDWFNKTGDVTLSLDFAPAGERLGAIPEDAWAHDVR